MARDYGIVASTFWTGQTGRDLRGNADAQLVALYLVTAPTSNMIGLYYLPLPTLCHEIGLQREGALKALRRVCQIGFARYDESSEWVWVLEMARYQLGPSMQPNDKRVKSVCRMFADASKCCHAQDFWKKYGRVFHIPRPSPFKGPSKPHRRGADLVQDLILDPDLVQDHGSNGVDDDFEKFWKAFPSGRKKSKGKAREKWAIAIRKADPSDLIAAAVEYANSEEGRGQYVKMPSTWLHGECWTDDRMAWKGKGEDDPRGVGRLLEKYTTETDDGDSAQNGN